MNTDRTAAVAVVVGFAFGAALGYRSTVNLNRTHIYTLDAPEVRDEW